MIRHRLLTSNMAATTRTDASANSIVTSARRARRARGGAVVMRVPSLRASCTFIRHNAAAGAIPHTNAVRMDVRLANVSTRLSIVVSVKRGIA